MKRHLRYIFICFSLLSCNEKVSNKASSNIKLDSTLFINASIDSLTLLILKDSLNASNYFQRAGYYMKINSLYKGLADLQNSVKLDPTNAEYFLKLGELNYSLQNSRVARDSWEKCSYLDPNSIDCRLNLAQLYLAVGELKKGQGRLNEVLDKDPQNSSALFLTGNYALMNKDTIKALKYIQAAINENQDFFNAYDLMGVLYSAKGDILALDYFNTALRLAPNQYDIHYKVGMFYQSLKLYEQALEAYERALEINPNHQTSMHNIAVISIFSQNYSKSIDYFTRAIQLDASYIEAYFGRGYAYELSGDLLKSELDYRTSLMLNPKYIPSREAMSRLNLLK